MVFQNGISLKIGKITYELLYRGSSKYTIIHETVSCNLNKALQAFIADNIIPLM